MTVVIVVHSYIVYTAGTLQMYDQTASQELSLQCPSGQSNTQSSLLLWLFGCPGYQFTNPSVLLSDVQVNVPSTYMSFPPTQYSQHFHHSGEHKADRKKGT